MTDEFGNELADFICPICNLLYYGDKCLHRYPDIILFQAAEIERLEKQAVHHGMDMAAKQINVENLAEENENLRREIERLKAQRNGTCKWVLEDNEYGVWDTGCGEAVVFDEETPKANGYKYCHYCGKLIEFEGEASNE
jgi:hypothetical protein